MGLGVPGLPHIEKKLPHRRGKMIKRGAGKKKSLPQRSKQKKGKNERKREARKRGLKSNRRRKAKISKKAGNAKEKT